MQSERIFVALSGGVDSAVSAALLLEQGYAVEGVYMKYASETVTGFVVTDGCSWEDDLEAVQAVGRHLGIPVRSINVESEYNQHVISSFLNDYASGRTPNPDILCNRNIKFGLFRDWVQKQGGRLIATGHYARTIEREGRMTLTAGRDPQKDQSYFLYPLSHEVLADVRFPIGDMLKSEVRNYARRIGLPNADRPDSQGVCFIGNLDVRSFLRSKLSNEPGPIITTDGQKIGEHQGLPVYTIGQRHGMGVGGGTPYFVIDKNLATNTLIVGASNDPALYADSLTATAPTFNATVGDSFHCSVRIRYRQPTTPATVIRRTNGTLIIEFDQPERAAAPGQAIVFYDGDQVLGGGTIDQVYHPVSLKQPV